MSDKVKVFFCTLCEKTWDQLPDAVQLTTTKRGGRGHANTYRFTADGSIHVIKKKTVPSTEEQQ